MFYLFFGFFAGSATTRKSEDALSKVFTPIKAIPMSSSHEFPNSQLDESVCAVEWDSRSPITMSRLSFYMVVRGLTISGLDSNDNNFP